MRRIDLLILLIFVSYSSAQTASQVVLPSATGKGLYHPDAVTSLDITPDGSVFATAGTNGEIRIWSMSTGELQKTINIKAKEVHISQVKYLKRGEQLLVNLGSDGIHLYDTKKNYAKLDQETSHRADRVSTSADAELWALQDGLSKIELVARKTMQSEMLLPEGRAIALSEDGHLVGFIHDKIVEVQEVPSGKPVFKWVGTTEYGHLSFSKCGRYLALSGDGVLSRVHVLDLQAKNEVATFDGEASLYWILDGKLLYRHRDRVCLWDNSKPHKSVVIADDVTQFAVSEDGKYLVSDGGRRASSSRLRRWNLQKNQELVDANKELQGFVSVLSFQSNPVLLLKNGLVQQGKEHNWLTRFEKSQTCHATTKTKIIVGSTQSVQIIDLNAPDQKPINVPGFDDGVSYLTCDASAQRLAAVTTGLQSQLVAVDVDGKHRTSVSLDSQIHNIAMTPDASAIFTFSRNGQITKYDAELKKSWTVRGVRSLYGAMALSPDGKKFAVATLIKATIHDASNGKILDTIERQWDDSPFVSLAFSKDSRMLAMGTRDSSGVLLWDDDYRAVVKRFRPAMSTIWDINFSESNRMLFTVGSGDVSMTWNVGRPIGKPPTSEELSEAWKCFGQVSPTSAWESMWILNDAKDEGIKVLEKGIKESKQRIGNIGSLIADLGHPNYQKRMIATNELRSIGTAAIPYLRKAQDSETSTEEQLARIETLLIQIANKTEKKEDNTNIDELLRVRRTVAYLRRNGSTDAKRLLENFPTFDTDIDTSVKQALGK